MVKICKFVSDNTPLTEPNVLFISQRDDGDIEIEISIGNDLEKVISFRSSGSRLKNWGKIIKKFSEIIDLINEDDVYNDLIN